MKKSHFNNLSKNDITLINNWKFTKLNSGLVKLFLLSFGVRISEKLLKYISRSKSIAKNEYYYDTNNDEELCKKYKLPSEIILPDDVETSFYVNEYSPLEIIISKKDKFQLLYFGRVICDLRFNYKPDFFDAKLSEGTYGSQYASMFGRHTLALFASGYCDYIAKNVGCRFCSLRSTREDLGKHNILALSSSKMSELFSLMTSRDINRIKYVLNTAGSYPDVDRGIYNQALIIKTAVKWLPSSISHHLTTMPPKDFKLVAILKEAGLQTLAYDIEVYNEHLFKFFCPGKDKYYGRKQMIKAIKESIKIFDHRTFFVGFIGGLEPIATLKEGMERFAAMGAGIAFNHFHPDANTDLANYPRPTPSYLIDLVRIQRDIYKKYDIIPVFREVGRRSSLDAEVYRGFFDDI